LKVKQTATRLPLSEGCVITSKPALNFEDFNNLLIIAIDKTLSSLGEKPKSAVYLYLEKALNLPKCEIPDRVDEFSFGLEGLFGLGARFLEAGIIQSLQIEAEVVFKVKPPNIQFSPNLTVNQYVHFIRKILGDGNLQEEQRNDTIKQNSSSELGQLGFGEKAT
jgi:hypothetical protein